MWGGGVESERSNSSSGAWGANVADASGTDSSNTWMSSTGASQGGWASGGGASTASKGGWDSQQQPSLMGSTGSNSQSGWQTGSNGVPSVNGWSGASGGGQTNWNTGSGQQWTGTSPGGGSTWAGVAGRNAHPVPAQANIQQNSGSNPGPAVATQNAVAVRPKRSTAFDGIGGTVGWGKPIDQGTPWEVRQSEGNANTFGGAPPTAASANQWTGGSGNGNGAQSWNSGGGGVQRESWQNQSANSRDGTPSYGGNGGDGGAKPVRSVSGDNESQHWGGAAQSNVGGGGWDSTPNQRHGSTGGNMWGNAAAEPSQQRDPAGNVWTGPPAPQDPGDSNMIWTNPYVEKKATQPDRGTSTWGDPTSQGEIKRWKTNNEGDILPAALANLQGGAVVNAQQTQSSGGTGSGNSGMQQNQQQTSTSPVWKDSPAQAQQQPPTGVSSWNSVSGGENQNANTGSGGWGDPAAQRSVSGPVMKSVPSYDPDGIQAAGWGGGAKPNDISRNSVESDGGNVSDDVFSNPTTPSTGPPGQPGSNKHQSQLPNGLGPHVANGSNLNLSQLAFKLGAQNAQIQNMPLPTTASGGGRVPPQVLTQQIADQLKAAVRVGLVDISMLYQPLPQETLLRLNQLLQWVPKLDQAQKEMALLQAQASKQPQGLSPMQQQELQRLNNEVKQLRQNMAALKQMISVQTQAANSGTNQQQLRNAPPGSGAAGTAGTPTDSGQSKLEQWKRGPANDAVNGGEGGVFGVGFSGSANDPWSNTPAKRNSGVDWPQSNPTTPGDMPKSPDKQSHGNRENDGQSQQSGDISLMSTPASSGSVGNETSSHGSSGGLTTPTLLDDVPEFKPGQPWNWRDPKELAEDPDATPGSVKRPALISVSSPMNAPDFFGVGTSPSAIGGLSNVNAGSDMMGGAALAAGMNAMNFGNGNAAMMAGNGGYPNFGNMPSNFYGQSKSGSAGFDLSKVSSPSGLGGPQQHGGLNDSWPARVSRPPSQMGQPIGGRAPYKHSMSTPNSTGGGFMPPYNMGASAPSQWVVLTNLNMMDEPTLQMMMSRVAPFTACMCPPGTGFAVVKFKDVSLDKIVPRLQQECSAVGITIQLAKDEEVSRLMQAVTGQRGAGGLQGSGSGHLFGPPPPPPPPHHPGAMGPAIWDAPPPQATWGAPPPPQAPGMHHHGAGGPFPPHPAAALTDPTVAAAAAMSMAMPPGMHDGLFAPVHDRHAPF